MRERERGESVYFERLKKEGGGKRRETRNN